MKKITLPLLILSAATLSGCELVGDIFQAGMWAGIIVVILVVAVVLWLVRRVFGGRR